MADCSKTVEFMREANRMCDSFEDRCYECPFWNNAYKATCVSYQHEHTEEAVRVLQVWSDAHPAPKQKTYADVFFEKFPNAPKRDDGTPISLWCNIYSYGISSCSKDKSTCRACWNEPYTESEN